MTTNLCCTNASTYFFVQVAAKQHEEISPPNGNFAGLLELSLKEVKLLKKMFLRILNWRATVTKEQFWAAGRRFLQEAIDSVDGLRVLRTLEAQNVSGLTRSSRKRCPGKRWAWIDLASFPAPRY